MIIKTQSHSIDSNDEPIILILSQKELIQIMQMPRKPEGEKYIFSLFPSDVSREIAERWLKEKVSEIPVNQVTDVSLLKFSPNVVKPPN